MAPLMNAAPVIMRVVNIRLVATFAKPIGLLDYEPSKLAILLRAGFRLVASNRIGVIGEVHDQWVCASVYTCRPFSKPEAGALPAHGVNHNVVMERTALVSTGSGENDAFAPTRS
jgi:hypothetical protein